MNDMKLIMENWRTARLLIELDGSEPAKWGAFRAMLKAMLGAKQGLVGQALASASGLTNFFGSSADDAGDAADIANAIAGMFESQETGKKVPLNEAVLTMGMLLVGMKVLGGVSAGKKAVGFLQGAYRKLRGRPTDATDNNPFLDMLNMDPQYAKMLDDRLEEQFLKWWLEQIQGKAADEVILLQDIDVNAKMQEFLKSEYKDRHVTGHTEPSTASDDKFQGHVGDVQRARGKVKKARAKRAVGMQTN